MRTITLLFFMLFLSLTTSAESDCTRSNLSTNMCPGYGYCTYYPLGEEGAECGKAWTLPKNWVAIDTDCLSNTKNQGTFSCRNKGTVKIVICGKSNCYKCLCQ